MRVPTVAVLQGHTFAAGALLALANDRRLMRSDRGFFCLPEVDISIPFAPGMSALIQSKLTPDTAQEAMLTGRRYGGTDAREAGIVSDALPEAELLPAATEWARSQSGKAGPTLRAIRRTMYRHVIDQLGPGTELQLNLLNRRPAPRISGEVQRFRTRSRVYMGDGATLEDAPGGPVGRTGGWTDGTQSASTPSTPIRGDGCSRRPTS